MRRVCSSTVWPNAPIADQCDDARKSGAATKMLTSRSNLFRHNIRRAITTAQETVGFLIANDLLLRGIELQRTTQTVRGIGQMHQCGRDVGFLNRRMNILGTPAANAFDEGCVMVTRTLAVWPGFGLIRQPGLVCIVSIDAEIAF